MKDATGLLVAVLAVVVGSLAEPNPDADPDGGHCIGSQCFAVFRHSADFASAQNHCKGRSGVLTTVRSYVAHDALATLLGNFSGRFWIGLHRLTDCPNATSRLRGYEWATKDAESDFDNWTPDFDGSCSSPRCVALSVEDELRWAQESCDARVAGFLCQYHLKYACPSMNQVLSPEEAVVYSTPLGFGGEDLRSLPPGSIATTTRSARKYVCFERWLPAPWSCEILEGGCEHKCAVDTDHDPSCSCPPGSSVNPVNQVTCEVTPGDPCASMGCEYACLEGDDGVHSCACDQGFKVGPDGRSCVDFNDCSDKRQCPGENFRCVNTVGGFKCECRLGFKMKAGLCVDHNECASAPCEHMCDNTPGSYKCSCYDGYRVDPDDPNKCELHCGKKECTAECDPNDKFQCYCPEGYIAEERDPHTACMDIDECAHSYCDHGCTNTYGSYVCSCQKGFTLVNEVFCEKNEDEEEEVEGSGGDVTTTPNGHTVSTTHGVAPTRQPSAVTAGGLVAIIVCCVLFVVLVVFLSQHILSRRGKVEGEVTFKAPERGERPGMHGMRSEA
ncbi:thrombomodulin [Syngnathoides biaculeatus]|uniref:thrombomodulin n=1 Tax=Syngnathoides biaculeatus TaxID=300417 RepID=UPI002ADDE177|nr:thrombomodulin [Syngnathoides biaculeatus]